MTELFFLARHTPFWAVPMLVLGGEFGYLFWLKKKKKTAIMCMMLALIGLSCNLFYIWAGGPEKSVKFIKKMHRDNK
ncbi:MAG: hypothetical protein H0V66_02265 [Bdellovibrionales bacterium]|nr:hypothetical protein [Bdellovibrionales bacterium]